MRSENNNPEPNKNEARTCFVKKLKSTVAPPLQYTIPFLPPWLSLSSGGESPQTLETAIKDMNNILGGDKSEDVEDEADNDNNDNDDENNDNDDEEDTAAVTTGVLPTKNICDILASISISTGITNLNKKKKNVQNVQKDEKNRKLDDANNTVEDSRHSSETLADIFSDDEEFSDIAIDVDKDYLGSNGNLSDLTSPKYPQSPNMSSSLDDLENVGNRTIDNAIIDDSDPLSIDNDILTSSHGSKKIERVSSNDTEYYESTCNPPNEESQLRKSILENLNPNILNDSIFMRVNESKDTEYGSSENIEKIKRMKLNIAAKLQDSFDLDEDDFFHANFEGWLVSDVLLQGHFCLTKDCLLFFSFIPTWYSSRSTIDYSSYDSHRIIQSGSLGMKAAKYGDSIFNTVITHRYWAVLRRENLCIYSSSTDMHFPSIIIDIKRCMRAEIVDTNSSSKAQNLGDTESKLKLAKLSKDDPDSDIYEAIENSGIVDEDVELATGGVWIKIVGKSKTYKFHTDSMFLARQWCNNLTKVIFSINNSNFNNEVLVKIPIDNLIDFKRTVLFSSNKENENTSQERDEEKPTVLSIKYLRSQEIHKGRTSGDSEKIVKDTLKRAKNNFFSNLLMDDIHFMFFSNGNKASKVFHNITYQHFETSDLRSKDKEKNLNSFYERKSNYTLKDISKNFGLSTLQLFETSSIVSKILSVNTHLESQIDSNATSKEDFFKVLGKGIPIPKIFLSSKKNTNKLKLLDSLTKPETDHFSNSPSPPEVISLPRSISLSNLQDLQMSLQATRKDLTMMESEYKERRLRSLNIFDNDKKEKDSSSFAPKSFSVEDKNVQIKSKAKQSKLKCLGKSLNVISNAGELLFSPSHYEEMQKNDDLFVKNHSSRMTATMNFHRHFSLSNTNLIASYQVNLFKGIPVYGKLYIGEAELCFRSLLPGISTKMILPLMDISKCEKEKGSKLGCSGLVLFLHGSDKITFEFNFLKARDDCELVILRQLHKVRQFYSGSNEAMNVEKRFAEIAESSRIDTARMKLFEDRFCSVSGLDVPMILEDSPFFKVEVKTTISLKFTLLTIGSRGDVQPFIALGKGLVKEGHQVTIATHGEFKDWILRYNLQFKEIAGNPVELMSLMVTHGSMSVGFLKEANSKFRSWITDLLRSSWEAAQGSDIIIESPSAMCGIHIAEALCIPYMRAFTMPWTRTRAYPHAFIVPEQNRGGSYNFMTHVMFETVFWKGISGQINKWRVEQLGIPRTNLSKLKQSRVPFLYNVSPTIFPPSVDFPDWVRVTGYWFLDEGSNESYQPPKDLVDFIQQARREKKKIVYIGFGSIVVEDAVSMTKSIVEAVLDADVRCVLNKGWSDRLSHDNTETEVKLPPGIFNSPAIPHDWLFSQIDAAVHHGGSGSTGASMRAGLPTIIKPFFGDQFFYASRVEAIGAGLSLKKLNSKSLSKALTTITSDEKILKKADDVGHKIRRENGVLNAIESIYLELEYSRTLILSKHQNHENDKQTDTNAATDINSNDTRIEDNEETETTI